MFVRNVINFRGFPCIRLPSIFTRKASLSSYASRFFADNQALFVLCVLLLGEKALEKAATHSPWYLKFLLSFHLKLSCISHFFKKKFWLAKIAFLIMIMFYLYSNDYKFFQNFKNVFYVRTCFFVFFAFAFGTKSYFDYFSLRLTTAQAVLLFVHCELFWTLYMKLF